MTPHVEQIEIRDPNTVTFSLEWDGAHLEGTLPGDAAYRVIAAAMAPSSVIRFDSPITPKQADEVRRRFVGRNR